MATIVIIAVTPPTPIVIAVIIIPVIMIPVTVMTICWDLCNTGRKDRKDTKHG